MPHLPRIPTGATLAGLVLAGATLTPAITATAHDAPAPDADRHSRLGRLSLVSADTGPLTGRVRIQRGQVIRPVRMVLPVEGYELTGRFGASSGLWSSSHTGLDFAVPQGTAIRAITDAVVVSTDDDGSYGLTTVLRTDDGTELWLCHQDSVTVSPGQRVAPGEEIGYVGMTGNTPARTCIWRCGRAAAIPSTPRPCSPTGGSRSDPSGSAGLEPRPGARDRHSAVQLAHRGDRDRPPVTAGEVARGRGRRQVAALAGCGVVHVGHLLHRSAPSIGFIG